MMVLNQPQARIPIGWAMVQGQRVPVEVDTEWARYFSTVTVRAGGAIGVSTTELSAEAFDDAGIEDTKATVYSNFDATEQAPHPESEFTALMDAFAQNPTDTDQPMPAIDAAGQIAELQAQVQELFKAINDLKQGLSL